jgi:hydroxyacylglutathione hydrolase
MTAFSRSQIAERTWSIEGVGCYAYLLVGDERAMMIDTGMSKLDLRAYVRALTRLPVSVVNTHGHFDHTGGNGWFDLCYMHAEAVKDAKTPFGDPGPYRFDYSIETVREGHVFDLGGRTIEVIEIPAHNPGSIALLDRTRRLLFTGDELEAGQVLLLWPDARCTVEGHLCNMKKLQRRSGEYDLICPGHNGTPIDKSFVDAFAENDQRVVDGILGTTNIYSSTFRWGLPEAELVHKRRSEHRGSAIVYDIRQIKA